MVIRAKKKTKKTDVSAPPEALVMRHTLLLYCFFFNLRYKLRRKGRTARILLLLSPVTLNEIL